MTHAGLAAHSRHWTGRSSWLLGLAILASLTGCVSRQVRSESVDPYDSVARYLGISAAEAKWRGVQQQRSAQLAEKLASRFPETFTGLRFENTPRFRIFALFARDGATRKDVETAAAEVGMGHPVELASAILSRSDEERIGDAIIKHTKSHVSFSIDPERGIVEVYTRPDAKLVELIKEVAGTGRVTVIFSPRGRVILTGEPVRQDSG